MLWGQSRRHQNWKKKQQISVYKNLNVTIQKLQIDEKTFKRMSKKLKKVSDQFKFITILNIYGLKMESYSLTQTRAHDRKMVEFYENTMRNSHPVKMPYMYCDHLLKNLELNKIDKPSPPRNFLKSLLMRIDSVLLFHFSFSLILPEKLVHQQWHFRRQLRN